MKKTGSSLIEDYLMLLGVPFTADYAEKQIDDMPFKTLFGLKKVLDTYGIKSEGLSLCDRKEITKLDTPFIANTIKGPVVVSDLSKDELTYYSQGIAEEISLANFVKAWTGEVMLSYPTAASIEPNYAFHARIEALKRMKKWVFLGCALFILIYLVATRHLYDHVPTMALILFDLVGLFFTTLLVMKSMNVSTKTGDKVCGVLQKGGCDRILEMSASKFFGLFGWSEVGFSYFSVSLVSLLISPETLPWLALCNVCCLPFTVWSIWYQRFRAHHWCTLCVGVQCTLWLCFFAYLAGGWLHDAWPLTWTLVAVGAAYLGVMLGLNALMPIIENALKNEEADTTDNQA
ncbi:MAG: hypothetical protein NC111_07190 [Bacteroides sp.]|nr:hypothetical protein [Bacteroides sp.]MCM1414013.1 hypothetical protein [Bacteroides sp.]MCM1472292.1 hypothetical protein [Bacteroides sp.]